MTARKNMSVYDSPATLGVAIEAMEKVLSGLSHPRARASVAGSIAGLKNQIKECQFCSDKKDILVRQQKKADALSRGRAKAAYKRWTSGEDAMLQSPTMSDRKIGLMLGRSRVAVSNRRYHLGLA